MIEIDETKQKDIRARARILELQQELAKTDYVALPDYDKDKVEVIKNRQEWRKEIRALEKDIIK